MAKPSDAERKWRPATRLVRGGMARSDFGETGEALFLTSGFAYDTAETAAARFKGEAPGHTYSRLANPTVETFERRMAILEGSERARATATGMAAMSASLLCFVRAGDHVVASRALFGSCLYVIEDILPRFGVETTLVDGADLEQWQAAVRPTTRGFFLETPSNPTLDIVDIAGVAEIAKAAGAYLIVDNVFATPMLQKPLELGADVVMYSATKHIDGQGRALGGILCCSADFEEEHLNQYLRHTGPAISPFNAWIMAKGLETLSVRVDRHLDNADTIARFLADHRVPTKVIHPGLPGHPQHALAMAQMSGRGGPIVAFEVPGGQDGAFRLLNALEIIDISNNLGDAKSLITHPTTTTHQRLSAEQRAALNITDGLVRLSVGLEDVRDLVEDLDRALAAV